MSLKGDKGPSKTWGEGRAGKSGKPGKAGKPEKFGQAGQAKSTKTNWASKEEWEQDKKARKGKKFAHPASDMTSIFIGAGKEAGVRPQDLVGALTGETNLTGGDVGAIKIFDRFSLVEVPDAAVDEVVWIMRRALIKGRKATVRRERDRS